MGVNREREETATCIQTGTETYGKRGGIHDDVIKWKHFPRYRSLCAEFIDHLWIPRTKASDAELWRFLWSEPEQTVGYIIETPVIWEAIAPIMTSLQCEISISWSYKRIEYLTWYQYVFHFIVISIRTTLFPNKTVAMNIKCTSDAQKLKRAEYMKSRNMCNQEILNFRMIHMHNSIG